MAAEGPGEARRIERGLAVWGLSTTGSPAGETAECRRARLDGVPESPRLRQEEVAELGLPGEEIPKLPAMDENQCASLDYARRAFGIGERQGEENQTAPDQPGRTG